MIAKVVDYLNPLTFEQIKDNTLNQPTRKFQFFNKKWVGPLFSGSRKDENSNQYAWIEKNRNYSNSGKEEFYIIRTGCFSFVLLEMKNSR